MSHCFKPYSALQKNYKEIHVCLTQDAYQTLKEFEKVKASHYETKYLKHPALKLKDYPMPNINGKKLRQGKCHFILKLRSKVTKVKVNMKNVYDSYECESGKNGVLCNPVWIFMRILQRSQP